ncbi:diguanylate cyclase [Dokdonella sp.]|uniref:ligand-binding sensor domain-containing diguanylate cyclase n=1 Tax=Dokdonella sp. TaxID=2291710 RepID=UPI003528192E
MRCLFLSLLLSFVSSTATHAAERAISALDLADEGAPTFTVFSSREGLSDEIWSTVGFDRKGFVWAGSASSLARFDGYRWTAWPFPEAHSLVRDMQADAEGTLWAIFEREGLASYDGERWALQPSESRFHQRFSETRTADDRSQLWVGLDDGFWKQDADYTTWTADPGNASVRQGPTASIAQTDTLFGGPRQWMAATADGLWYRDIDNTGITRPWQRFELLDQPELHSTDLMRTVNQGVEELWLLTYGDGLYRIREDGIRVWRAASGELPTEAIYSAVATRMSSGKNAVWLASRAGLLRVIDDEVAVFDRRHGLPSDAVRGIKLQRSMDGTDLLWLATERGIARAALADTQWQTVSLLGARENGIFSVLPEDDGKGGQRVWVGTSKQGLGLLQDGEWQYFTRANGTLPDEGVRQIWNLAGPDGTRWRLLSLNDGALLRVSDDLEFTPLPVPWQQRGEDIATHALSRVFQGKTELWFATLRSGVYRFRNGDWTNFPIGDAGKPWSVVNLGQQVDAHGRSWIWAAGQQGLARFDGSEWTPLTGIKGLPEDGFRGVTVTRTDAGATLWASSNRNGVVRLAIDDPRNPVMIKDDAVPAPPDPTVYSVLEDSRGRIYVCTNNGVQLLTPKSDGPGYSERVFRRRDGLVHDECNTNTQVIDANDRYWVGTLGGLSMFDPEIVAAPGHAVPKPLHFSEMIVDGRTIDPEGSTALDLPAGTRDLMIGFTLLSGIREQDSTFRTELVGHDDGPGAWTEEHQRRYSALAPGSYALKVEARDYAGIPSSPRTLHFSVKAHWWELPWVRLLFVLLVLAAASGLVLLYNRGLRARQRHLKREVARRTLEIRSANERLTELSYQDPLTGVANRRRLMEAADAAIERAVTRGLPIGLIVIDVDHFKDYNDRHGHLAGDVALRAVAQALASVTREQDLVARFGGEEFACLMVDASIDLVARCAERMRALVEALPPRTLGNDSQTITISAGVMSRVPAPGDHAADLLRETDSALYRAKHEGRNRVCRSIDAKRDPVVE